MLSEIAERTETEQSLRSQLTDMGSMKEQLEALQKQLTQQERDESQDGEE